MPCKHPGLTPCRCRNNLPLCFSLSFNGRDRYFVVLLTSITLFSCCRGLFAFGEVVTSCYYQQKYKLGFHCISCVEYRFSFLRILGLVVQNLFCYKQKSLISPVSCNSEVSTSWLWRKVTKLSLIQAKPWSENLRLPTSF